MKTIQAGDIVAPGGRINIASIHSKAEINTNAAFENNNEKTIQPGKMGDIHISGKSLIDVSGSETGSIYIRGGNLEIHDSKINSQTMNDHYSGSIKISVENILFSEGASINVNTFGKGNSGNLYMNALNSIIFEGDNNEAQSSGINMNSFGLGNGGTIFIEAENLFIRKGGTVINGSFAYGNSGNIHIYATESIRIEGIGDFFNGSVISTVSYLYGNSGKISLEAPNISLKNGGVISSTTVGSGRAGDINIRTPGTLSLTGVGISGSASYIMAMSFPIIQELVCGDAGTIEIDAGNLILLDGAAISTDSINRDIYQSGMSGDINILVDNETKISGINP